MSAASLVVGRVMVAPGQRVDVVVQLTNDDTRDRAFVVTVLGLDTEWLPAPLRTPVLVPGQTADVTLSLLPAAGTPAGEYAFVVAAQSVDDMAGAPPLSVQSEGAVIVGDAAALALELVPREPAGMRTRRVEVQLTNRGTAPMDLSLSVTAGTGLDVWLRERDVHLDGGESVGVRGRVTANRRRWIGQPRRMPFVITAQGHTVPVRLNSVFVGRPVFNRTVTRLLAALAVVTVWASVALVGLDAISKNAHKKESASLTQLSINNGGGGNGSSNGGSGSGGSGSGGSGSGGSGSGSGGAGGAGSSGSGGQSTTTRLNGTVTGSAPGGVTVSIRPTSLVDEQSQGITFVNAASTVALGGGQVGKLSASSIDLARPKTDSVVRRTSTANDGSFAFAGIKAPGYYLVTLSKPGYQTAKYVINAQLGQKLPTLSVPLQAGKGKLSGTVFDAKNHTLGGAHVTLTNGAITLATNTPSTGKNPGTWSIDGLSTPGTYLVSASRDGYDLESTIVTLAANGTATQNITLQPGVESLTGTIRDANNNGIAGATITATLGSLTRTVTSVSDTPGSSSPIGSYVLPALPIGNYTLTISAPGFAPQTAQAVLNGKSPSLTKDAVLTSATGTLGGIITDVGVLPNVPLVASAGLVLSGDNGTYKTMSVSGTGAFTFTGVAPGDYVLTATSFRYITNFADVTVHAGDNRTDFALSLDRDPTSGVPQTSHITGSVVDAHTGAAFNCPASVPTCTVTVDLYDGAGTLVGSTTKHAGEPYQVPTTGGLSPGLYTLRFAVPGYESGAIKVPVPADTLVTAQPVALVPEGVLLGHVSSPGDVISGCVVALPITPASPSTPPAAPASCPTPPSAADAPTACTGPTPNCTATIGTTGDYEIDFVPAGTYWMYVLPDHAGNFVAVTPAQVTVQPGQSQRYDVSVNRLAMLDIIVQEPNSAGDAVNVGSGITVHLTGPSSLNASTDTSGVASFGAVPQGSYTMSATDATTGQTRTLSGVNVGLNQHLTLPLVLLNAGSPMIGRIFGLVDGSQVPLSNATVTVTGVVDYSGSVAHRRATSVRTDSSGCFALNNAVPGTLVTKPVECGSGTFNGTSVADAGFVASTVDVVVDPSSNPAIDRYGQVSRTNFLFSPSATTTAITLPVPPTSVAASVVLNPTPALNGKTASQATVQVTQVPPGAGAVVASVNADGTLHLADPTLSASQQANNGLIPGTYHLRATLDGFDPVNDYTLTVPADTASADNVASVGMPVADFTATPLTLQEHGALTLSAVDDTSAAAVDGAVFTVSGAGIITTTVTAPPASNTVTIPDLSVAGGPYTVVARAPGYHFASQSFAITAGAPTTANVVGTLLGSLTGTVLGRTDGNHTFPLAGVRVTASDGTSSFSSVTASDGTYSITGTVTREGLALNSTWTVTASVYGYGSASVSGVAVGATGGPVPVSDIVMDANTVNATIIVRADGTGTPLDGASVSLNNSTALVGGTTSCTTNGSATPAGSCVFSGISPTTYSLVVTKPGYAPLSTAMILQVGLADQTVVVTLVARTNTISGTVIGTALDGSTKSLWNSTDGLSVTLTSTEPGSSLSLTQTPGSASVSGVAGNFSFTGLPDNVSGTYVLTVSSNASTGFQGASRPVTVSGGQVASVEITLQPVAPQRVTVTVLSSSGRSMAGATVTLVATDGVTVVQTAAPAEPVSSGGNPVTVFNQVPQGSYRVHVEGVNGHLTTTTSTFAVASSPVSITATVSEQVLRLTATSVRAAGTVPPIATFTITNTSSSAVISPSPSVTADNNTVEVYVPPASYSVSAALGASDAPNYSTPSSQSVTQAPNSGATNWVQSLTFSFTQTITTSLTVSISGTGAATTVTVKGGDLSSSGVSCTTSGGSTNACTVTVPPNTYTVSATTGGGTPKVGTVSGVTVVQGSNSVTVAVA